MRTAYFDCFSGISGDMLIGSLLDAGLDFKELERELGKLGLQHVELSARSVTRHGIAATKFDVVDQGKQAYRHLSDLNRIVDEAPLSEPIKDRSKTIFSSIAAAEAKCHGVPVERVHFHEIGAVDTIIDVVGSLVGLEQLGIGQIVSSSLNVGSGTVEFSHGVFPVPAPATTELLRDIPIYATNSRAELVTPTGAAIITMISDRFGEMPELTVKDVGYGAGSRDLAHPNVLRILVGEAAGEAELEHDIVTVIDTTIDDMNPQLYEHVVSTLLDSGALEAYLTPIIMKKSRPAIKLTVLCGEEKRSQMSRIIFEHTTSIGLRHRAESRKKLSREIVSVETKFGDVHVKVASLGDEILNAQPEYEECLAIARQMRVPIKTVLREVESELVNSNNITPRNLSTRPSN